jgi:hypothetical protein
MEKWRQNWPIWLGEHIIGIASLCCGLLFLALGYKWSSVFYAVGTGFVWEFSGLLRRRYQRYRDEPKPNEAK